VRVCEVLVDGAWVPGRLLSWARDSAGGWVGSVLLGTGDDEREVVVGAAALRPGPARHPDGSCACPAALRALVVDLPDGARRATAVPEGAGGPVSGLLLARCERCGGRCAGPWRLTR
jgi:hypothetical protein